MLNWDIDTTSTYSFQGRILKINEKLELYIVADFIPDLLSLQTRGPPYGSRWLEKETEHVKALGKKEHAYFTLYAAARCFTTA